MTWSADMHAKLNLIQRRLDARDASDRLGRELLLAAEEFETHIRARRHRASEHALDPVSEPRC